MIVVIQRFMQRFAQSADCKIRGAYNKRNITPRLHDKAIIKQTSSN